MGARGRTPKPMEQVVLENRRGTMTRRKDEPMAVSEEELPVLSPTPSAEMTQLQDVKFWFTRFANYLYGVGVLRQTDEMVVWLAAEAAERVQRFSDMCRGEEVIDVDGRAVQNPIYMNMVIERAALERLLKQIGMTPTARSRLIMEASIAGANQAKTKRYDFDA